MEALKGAIEERWPVISDAIIVDALVSVTVKGHWRPALAISSWVQKCAVSVVIKRGENREQSGTFKDPSSVQ